jgi:hypothetical protein
MSRKVLIVLEAPGARNQVPEYFAVTEVMHHLTSIAPSLRIEPNRPVA